MTRTRLRFAILLAAASLLAPSGASAQEPKVVETESNDHLGLAQEVPARCEVHGTFRDRGDQDWYRLHIPELTFLRARLSPVEGVDHTIVLRDEKGRTLLSLNGQPAGRPEVLLRRLPPGVYVLTVAALGVEHSGKLDYVLSLTTDSLLDREPSAERIHLAIRKGLAHLAANQTPEGGWEAKTGPFGITGLALAAFAGSGLDEFEEAAVRAAAFFKKAYVSPAATEGDPKRSARSGGSFVGWPCPHFMYQHSIATLAMASYLLHHEDAEARRMLAGAVDLLLRSQNTSAKPELLGGPVAPESPFRGGWKYSPQDLRGDISVSGWCFIALVAARNVGLDIPGRANEEFTAFCGRCFSDEKGGFGYAPDRPDQLTNTTNSVGVLGLLLCGEGKDPRVEKGMMMICDNFPLWEVEGGNGRYPFYYWYNATRARYVAGGDCWKRWRNAVCEMLLEHQDSDGSWDADQNEKLLGRVYSTALAVLILELCGGRAPAYLDRPGPGGKRYTCPMLVDDIEALLEEAVKDGRGRDVLIAQIRALIGLYRAHRK